MPRVTNPHPSLAALVERQDGVATVEQLVAAGYHRATVHRKVREGHWQRPMPGVLVLTNGGMTRRQRLIVAWLWAGPDSAIDAEDACVWQGFAPATFDPEKVHVVVPATSGLRSRDFVVVRRTIAEVRIAERGHVPYVSAADAVIVAARNAKSLPSAINVLSRPLQMGLVDVRGLRDARARLGDKFCAPVDRALLAVGVGVRSSAEEDSRRLLSSLRHIPAPSYNQWIDLGDGGSPVCVDALWLDAGLVHEVNGKRWHMWDRTFENMQARHDRLTAAGLIVLHNSPSRIRREPDRVCAEIVRTYVRYAGSGLPDGVRPIDPPPWTKVA